MKKKNEKKKYKVKSRIKGRDLGDLGILLSEERLHRLHLLCERITDSRGIIEEEGLHAILSLLHLSCQANHLHKKKKRDEMR